jgi:hypothetical protein
MRQTMTVLFVLMLCVAALLTCVIGAGLLE